LKISPEKPDLRILRYPAEVTASKKTPNWCVLKNNARFWYIHRVSSSSNRAAKLSSTSGIFMKISKIVLASVLAVGGVSAFAQAAGNGVYADIGYTSLKVSGSGLSVSPALVRAIVGKDINDTFSVEGMLGFSAKKDSVTVTGVKVDFQVSNATGVFLKARNKVSESVEVFGRLGYVGATLKGSSGAVSVSDSGDGIAYGAGLSFKVAANTALTLDYASYYSKDGTKMTGTTAGVKFNF
jgi:outer membrane autotransporter protein